MTSACATPPHRKPRARLNANTNSGKCAFRPTSPVKKSQNCRKPTNTSTPCAVTIMPGKSIAKYAKPRNGRGTLPERKTAPSCARPRLALGGRMSGAYELPLKWAAMAACPSAPSACASKNRPAPSSFSVSIPPDTTPCLPPRPTKTTNPHSSLPIAPNKPVLSC
jgi:hypothetical protein